MVPAVVRAVAPGDRGGEVGGDRAADGVAESGDVLVVSTSCTAEMATP